MKTLFKIAAVMAAAILLYALPVAAQSDDSEFVIIANKQMQGGTINSNALKGIYLREVRSWANGGGSIIPVDLTSGAGFYQNLFGKSYVQMQAYWVNMRVKYSVDLPVTKKDAAGVKQFVAENKGAIGFIKSGDVDDSVKVLKLVN